MTTFGPLSAHAKIRNNSFLVGLRVLLPIVFLMLAASGARAVSDTYDWYRGADGYAEALEKATAGERPLVLFFYVDWCPWCKRLRKEYLDDRNIDDFLGDFLRVEINPEQGKKERELFTSHGGTGYPTFLLTFPGVEKRIKPYPFLKSGAISTEDFLTELKKGMASLYIQRGYKFRSAQEYEKAVPFFHRAVECDPESVEADYGLGVCYTVIGGSKKDMAILEQAEASLLRALKKKPDYEPAKTQLAELRKTKGKIEQARLIEQAQPNEALDRASATAVQPSLKKEEPAPKKAEPSVKKEEPQVKAAQPPLQKAAPAGEPSPGGVKEIESALSKIILETSPRITRIVKGSWPTFVYQGYLCTLVDDGNRVNLHFLQGARIQDERGKLTGTGRIRSLSFQSGPEIDAAYVQALVKEAMKINDSGEKP